MTEPHVATEDRIDAEFASDFGNRWITAWNSHEPDRLLALMTDDIVYDDAAWPRTMRGHDDVREFLDHAWKAFPDLRFLHREGPFVHPSAPMAAFWWDGFGTHLGPLDPPGLAPTGKAFRIDGVDFHEYRDGKVARLRINFDMASVMRQLGVLPAMGSREERLIARLANVRGRLGRARR